MSDSAVCNSFFGSAGEPHGRAGGFPHHRRYGLFGAMPACSVAWPRSVLGSTVRMSQQFEWDAGKALANLKKHGVAFDEALTVFADPLARILDDPDHSFDERREVIIGHSTQRHVLVVGFTERETKTRIISARSATAQERQKHEENSEHR